MLLPNSHMFTYLVHAPSSTNELNFGSKSCESRSPDTFVNSERDTDVLAFKVDELSSNIWDLYFYPLKLPNLYNPFPYNSDTTPWSYLEIIESLNVLPSKFLS
jgi:hypothetical protein